MFRSKSILWDKCPRSCPGCNLPDEMAICIGGAKVEPTTMQVDDRLAWSPMRRPYPKSGYAAEAPFLECHVLPWQYTLQESVVRSAGFDSRSHALAGAEHWPYGGGNRGVFGIEWMDRNVTCQCAVSSRVLCSRLFFRHVSYLKDCSFDDHKISQLVLPVVVEAHRDVAPIAERLVTRGATAAKSNPIPNLVLDAVG